MRHFCATVCGISLSLIVAAHAADNGNNHSNGDSGPTEEHVDLVMNHLKIFRTKSAFNEVKIGQEKAVTVFPQSDRELLLKPMAFGTTNILLYDNSRLVEEIEVVINHEYPQPFAKQKTILVYDRSSPKVPGSIVGYSEYRCTDQGCAFLKQSEYQTPVERYSVERNDNINSRNINVNQNQ